jgi:hypothetical protein
MRRIKAGVLAAIATAAVMAALAVSSAQGLDNTCVLALTKTDPATVNTAFPDESATYWIATYQAMPGLRIRIDGAFPHARYMSFNVYDGLQRPLDALADDQLKPKPESMNPFLPGADRTAPRRSYTAFIDFGPPPTHRAPNTLYAGRGQNGVPNANGSFILRTYIPDRGRDETGGVGLPTVTVEQASDGRQPPPSVCRRVTKPSVAGINERVAASNGFGKLDPIQPWGQPKPTWNKFVNLPQGAGDFLLDNPHAQQARPAVDPIVQRGGNGGFLSNIHNAYLATPINRAYGKVLVTRFKAPSFPDTRRGTTSMPGNVQLRYWSMCENEFFSQRFVACRADDQTRIGPDGYVNYVISTPSQRPTHATPGCGYTWIPWGPDPEGVLIYRHMLADGSFVQAIQKATYGKEADTMGPYLPVSRYYADKAAFDSQAGCPAR